MRILFIAPHLSAAALDDTELVTTARQLSLALALWVDKTSPSDTHDQAIHRVHKFLGEADHHILTARLYLLHLSMEHEYRFQKRLPEAKVLDRVPFQGIGRWPIHTTCIGEQPADEQAAIVSEWRARAEVDDLPMWTRRPMPEWLPERLWATP